MLHGQLDGDLAAERVAQHHHGRQSGRLQPVGQMVGMLGDVQHPAGIAAEPKAGQVDHVDRVMADQPGGQRHEVAVGDGQPVEQDHRRGVVGMGERAAVMDRDASGRPPAALEPPRGAGGACRQPIPITASKQGARHSSHRPRSLLTELH